MFIFHDCTFQSWTTGLILAEFCTLTTAFTSRFCSCLTGVDFYHQYVCFCFMHMGCLPHRCSRGDVWFLAWWFSYQSLIN